MRRVELFELIRKDRELKGLSIREISNNRGIHRRMVRQALNDPVPPERKKPVRPRPVMNDKVCEFIDGILESDRKAPPKQRHTAHRIWQRLQAELRCTAAEGTVRNYVHRRKRELAIGVEAFVPQHHPAGAQAEVDFYEAELVIAGEQVTAQVVALRSEFSAGSFHAGYPHATQSAFLEGMAKGFEFLGGTPAVVRFDNLTLAVARVLRGKQRIQQDRFIAFRSHYLFEASFTTPGIRGAHEKGGIENECGRFRRRWLTPMPCFNSWEEFNDYLLAGCIKDLDRRLEGNNQTVGELVMVERPLLRALPAERFETAALGEARVDQKCRIRVHTNHYSVPASLVGRVITWRLSPLSLEVFYHHALVARHPVLRNRCGERLVLDHYLEVLSHKPGAMAGSLPLHQPRAEGWFDANYEQLWSALRQRLGESGGTSGDDRDPAAAPQPAPGGGRPCGEQGGGDRLLRPGHGGSSRPPTRRPARR
jgi:transposase